MVNAQIISNYHAFDQLWPRFPLSACMSGSDSFVLSLHVHAYLESLLFYEILSGIFQCVAQKPNYSSAVFESSRFVTTER